MVFRGEICIGRVFGRRRYPEDEVFQYRLHFTYKKTTAVPRKADPVKQKEFVEKYGQLKAQKGKEDKILFMDGTHPQHNSMPAYGEQFSKT